MPQAQCWSWPRHVASGVTRLQWAMVQVFQKGPLFPPKNFKKTASGKFWAPHSAGPACTARLARPIVTPLHVAPCLTTGRACPTTSLDRKAASQIWISNGSANHPFGIPAPVNHPEATGPCHCRPRGARQLLSQHPRAAHWLALAVDAALALGRVLSQGSVRYGTSLSAD